MLDSLKIIVKETLEIYSLATLGGSLFIPFFLCLVYLLFSPGKEDDRARNYLVYPSLVLILFLFNPVLIHLLYKYIEVPERIVRIYWPLPMDMIFVYCLIRLFSTLREGWKKALLLGFTLFLLFIGAKGTLAGDSYTRAENALKLPRGTKEVSDQVMLLSNYQSVNVIMPKDLFFWTREYCPYIRVPFVRDMDKMSDENGVMNLELVAEYARLGDCPLVILNSSAETMGDLNSHGFKLAASIDAQDFQYLIYQAE